MIPVLRQAGEREVVRQLRLGEGLGARLEEPDEETADLFPRIDVGVGVARDRQTVVDAVDCVGDEIAVLHRMQRHGNAGQAADVARPRAAGQHRGLAGDSALIGLDGDDLACLSRPPRLEAGDAGVLENRYTELTRRLRDRLGDVRRVDAVGLGHVKRAEDVVAAHEGIELRHLFRGHDVGLSTDRSEERGLPAIVGQAVFGLGQRHGAAMLEADVLSRLRGGRGVERDAVAHHLREFEGAADDHHVARGVPSGAGGHRVALDEDDVRPSELGQAIGDRATGDAAADDHGAGLIG